MKFSITDIDATDPAAMRRAAGVLTALAAAVAGTVPPVITADWSGITGSGKPADIKGFPPIDIADNPAMGAEVVTPQEVFGGNPVVAFGVPPGTHVGGVASPDAAALAAFGRVESAETATGQIDRAQLDAAAAFGSHGSPELDADAAKLNALAGPGAAGPTLGNVGIAGAPGTSGQQTASSAPAAPAGVTVDKTGLPWDARIHASSKAMNADKTWRGKRNVDPALAAQVEAELRTVMALPGTPAPTIPAPPVGNVPPPISAPGATSTIPTAPAGASFVSVMTKVGALTLSGKLTEAEATSAVLAVGLQSFPQLVNRPDLAQAVSDTLDQIVAQKG